MHCRHCQAPLSYKWVDLGNSPPSNAYLDRADLNRPETYFPLTVWVCEQCWLVQTEDYAKPEDIFNGQYAYFSSYSSSWLDHSYHYVESMVERLSLDHNSMVVEIAANDGYLLQYVQARGIPCYGVEPTASTAQAARHKNIEIIQDFFGSTLAQNLSGQGKQADLIIANNVLGHVPDINDFARGCHQLMKPNGVVTFEFPQLTKISEQNQFDTIYHEHYSYLSLTAVQAILSSAGMNIFDVQELNTHGGSLRVFAERADSGIRHAPDCALERVASFLRREESMGLKSRSFYAGFQARVNRTKNELVAFLIDLAKQGKTIGAYGAAAKGNALLNFSGVRPDLLPWVVDRNPSKQNKFLPGSHIPIVKEEVLFQEKPEYILILPWNLRQEIEEQLSYTRNWGATFVIAIPQLTFF